jgi:hypothetical protein
MAAGDLLIMDRVRITPEWRGFGIGALAAAEAIHRLSSGCCAVACEPAPTDREFGEDETAFAKAQSRSPGCGSRWALSRSRTASTSSTAPCSTRSTAGLPGSITSHGRRCHRLRRAPKRGARWRICSAHCSGEPAGWESRSEYVLGASVGGVEEYAVLGFPRHGAGGDVLTAVGEGGQALAGLAPADAVRAQAVTTGEPEGLRSRWAGTRRYSFRRAA